MSDFIKLERSSSIPGILAKRVFINVNAIQMIDFDPSPNGEILIWLSDGRSAQQFRATGKNNAEIAMLVYGKENGHE